MKLSVGCEFGSRQDLGRLEREPERIPRLAECSRKLQLGHKEPEQASTMPKCIPSYSVRLILRGLKMLRQGLRSIHARLRFGSG